MITREHQRVTTTLSYQEIQVLVNRVRGAEVPGRVQSLLRRPDLDELTERAREEIPTRADVIDETLGLVLGEYRNATHARIDTIRECEVDIAEVASESDRGLALPAGQLSEAGAVATGENECDRIPFETHIQSILCSHHNNKKQ
jgi:hypothetical protein